MEKGLALAGIVSPDIPCSCGEMLDLHQGQSLEEATSLEVWVLTKFCDIQKINTYRVKYFATVLFGKLNRIEFS